MFRRTVAWIVILGLAAAVAGGAYVGWSVSRANEAIRDKLLAFFAEKAPHWEVSIERAEFDWNRTIRVHGSTVRPKGENENLLVLPEIVVTIDRDAFDRDSEVVLDRIRLVGPQVRLRRTAEGDWNWQKLFPLESKDRASLPEWIVEDANVSVRLDHANGESTSLPVGRVNGKVVPSGKRRFEVVGRVDVEGTGAFELSGDLDVDRKTWSFGGRAVDLVSGEELVDLATRVAPETRTRIAELEERLDGWLPENTGRRGVRVAENSNDGPTVHNAADTRRVGDSDPKPLGIDGRLALEFRLEQPAGGKAVNYSVQADFDGAQLDHPVLPFPLHDVDGRITWGNERFAVENFAARNGVTRIAASGSLTRGNEATGRFELEMKDVVLDERLRSRLTGRLRTVYDSFRPTGRADFSTRILVAEGSARTENLVLNLKQANAAYAAFPYPVERLNGSLAQQGDDLVVDLAGFGGRVPVQLKGMVRDFAGEAEASFTVTGKGLPVDRTFLEACQPEVREAFEAMQLEGRADLAMRFLKPAGRDERWRTRIEADLHDGSMEFEGFPYRVTKLTGRLVGTTHDGTWRFEELAGNHGDALLTAFGSFVKPDPTDPGRLRLRIITRNAALDRQLRDAFDDDLQSVWRSLDPTGRIDVVTDVDWIPGRSFDLRLPAVAITKGTMRPDALPLRFTDVTLEGAYAEGRFDVAKFSAKHRDTGVRSKGFVETDERGRWRLRFDDLFVDDLDAGPGLRNALPKALADVHEAIDLEGKISLSGRAEFRGSKEDGTVTAAWELDTVLTGNRFFAGVPVEDAYGSLTSKGTYDGRKTVADGNLDLDSLTAQGYQLTRVKGPYRIDGTQLLLGSRKAFAEKVPPIALDERVTAKAIDGTVVVDGLYVGGREPSYNFKFLLSNGRLESYAERYLPGTKNLAGVMNGWLDLYGRGVEADDVQGRGQLQISPAALYELPLVVKLFTALPFRPPNRDAAFDYALLDFRIARQRFVFDAVDLVGDALRMRGRGTVGFDQSVNLDFYSEQPRSQLNIPVVRFVVGEAARGLVAVYVRGSLDRPQTQVVTAPTVDAALKSFLGRLTNPGPPPTSRIRNVLPRPLGGRSSNR